MGWLEDLTKLEWNLASTLIFIFAGAFLPAFLILALLFPDFFGNTSILKLVLLALGMASPFLMANYTVIDMWFGVSPEYALLTSKERVNISFILASLVTSIVLYTSAIFGIFPYIKYILTPLVAVTFQAGWVGFFWDMKEKMRHGSKKFDLSAYKAAQKEADRQLELMIEKGFEQVKKEKSKVNNSGSKKRTKITTKKTTKKKEDTK